MYHIWLLLLQILLLLFYLVINYCVTAAAQRQYDTNYVTVTLLLASRFSQWVSVFAY